MNASAAWQTTSLALDMFPNDEAFKSLSSLIQRGETAAALEIASKEAASEKDTERLALIQEIKGLLEA